MDATTTLHISLPKALKAYVKKRVGEKQYSNPSDYVRTLIREDQVRRDEELLERMLLEGLASGKGELMTDEDWKTMRRSVCTGISNRSRRV
jgi:antitoxin ParD1/3/4